MASILPKILRRKKEEQKEKFREKSRKEATGKRKKKERIEKSEPEAKSEKPKQPKKEAGLKTPGDSDIAFKVLVNPRITEKTTDLSKAGVYTFDVFARTNKVLIKKAVEELYRVKVKKVRLANMPEKPRLVRGKRGARPGYKKALVYLKEGEKIEFI